MRPRWPIAVVLALAAGTAAAADVAVDATAAPFGIIAGRGFVDVTLFNTAPGTSENVVLTVALGPPATFRFVFQLLHNPAPECTTPAVGQSGSVVCTNPTFTGGAIYRVGFAVPETMPEGASVTINVSVSTTSPDDMPSNNTDSVTVPVTVGFADVSVEKRLVSTESLGGVARLTFQATATNLGPHAARDLVLSDVPSPGLVTQSYTCTRSLRDESCCPVICRAASLAVGESMTLTYVATAEERFLPLVRNTARVTSTADANPANNEAVATAAEAVPTLGEAALLLLMAAVAVAGTRRLL